MAQLPISSALTEASPESISELFSRAVEPMDDTDIERLIVEFRAQRERMEAAENAPKMARSRGIREEPAPAPSKVAIKGLVL